MVVPLVARSRTIGAITFVFAESRREYTTDQLALAEDLGRRAGLAVDNARLHDAERRANERLRELQAVTDLGLAHLGLDDLLRELLRRIRDVTGSDTAAVLLHDAGTGTLRTRAALGEPSAPAGATLEVPLREGGQVLGVLRVSAREERPFDRDDVELLDLVADRAARAITHARLYEQANDVAVTLQRSLLSHTVPPIAGLEIAVRYQPGEAGTQVGGDWYDAFPLDGDCWGLVVGDVVGRGLTAAATMGQLRASLRAYAHEHPAPADAIDRLDQLALVLDEVPFATLAMLSVSPVDGEGHICVAGHPLPVLRDATGHASLLDVPIGPPLALRGDGRRAYPIALDPGATLLLYTDGLVERRDQPLDDRLAELEQAMADGPEDVEGLADHVLERMLGGSPSGDDAAIVVVRRPAQP
jgi:serine phosphatase RsbU (regulator of sigma subunit)